jgi:transposase
MHNAENPVCLIWDGHPIHRSKKVKDCVNSFNGKLEIYTLPGYSPELNPVEQIWNNVKNHGIGRKKVFGPDHLKGMLLGQLRKLQKLPCIVKSFFHHPECSYILA